MEEEIVSLAKKLIAIPSVTGDKSENQKILNLVLSELRGLKHTVFTKNGVESLLFYTGNSAREKHDVLLSAHLDIVPGNKGQFSPTQKGDKLFGRGAYDMKAAAAALILLYKNLALGVQIKIALQIVTDEETGGHNGAGYQAAEGVNASFVLAGENTDLLINNEAKGVLQLKLTCLGKAAHGAYPWLGKNALWEIIQIAEKIQGVYPIPKKDSWDTTANLSIIQTPNTVYNKVPDEASVFFDIRFTPQDEAGVLTSIKRIVPRNVKIEVSMHEPSVVTPVGDPYIKKLQESLRQITHKTGQLVSKHGGSDVRFYSKMGASTVTFGPVGANHHADDEWVSIKSLAVYYEVLRNFLLSQ